MISTWEEAKERFDTIKDHKPRAVKKLNELGEILASAYRMNPQKADEMWQYIIDLNVADNEAFAKYYVTQVFNRMTDLLSDDECADYITLSKERVYLLFKYKSTYDI